MNLENENFRDLLRILVDNIKGQPYIGLPENYTFLKENELSQTVDNPMGFCALSLTQKGLDAIESHIDRVVVV